MGTDLLLLASGGARAMASEALRGTRAMGRVSANLRALAGFLHDQVETPDMQEDFTTATFKLETELRDPVVGWAEASLDNHVGVDECDVGRLAPDLIFGEFGDLDGRLDQDIDPLTNWPSIAALQRFSRGEQPRLPAHVLRALLNHELLEEREPGVFEVVTTPIDPFIQLTAIELKMRDWRKAVRQASRYRGFAEASYVAMPEERISDEVLVAARGAGVGVLAVLASGLVERRCEADSTPVFDPRLKMLASELVFSSWTGHRSFDRVAGSFRGPSIGLAAAPI